MSVEWVAALAALGGVLVAVMLQHLAVTRSTSREGGVLATALAEIRREQSAQAQRLVALEAAVLALGDRLTKIEAVLGERDRLGVARTCGDCDRLRGDCPALRDHLRDVQMGVPTPVHVPRGPGSEK